MAAPFLQGAFTAGEITPALFGRYDLSKLHVAASTARNAFVRYQGGLSSRAGTAFVGYSKQTGRPYPPRMIPFQFSINQGLELEFGNFYMRVILNGAFVLEAPSVITGASKTNPLVLTITAGIAVASAVAIDTAVISSYAPGELVTLDGGTAITAAVLSITTTKLIGVQLNAVGASYAINDLITLSGGGGTPAVIKVLTVDGSGHILTFSINSAGSYTTNPTGLAFTQASTTGGGTGATFNFALMAPNTVAVHTAGVYTAAPPNPVAQASTTGVGIGATFTITTTTAPAFQIGDWVIPSGVQGMTQINGQTYVVSATTATTITLQDIYGNNVDATGFSTYVNGGEAARIFTLVTPYADQDLPFLKFTQSADVMSLCLVNQDTFTEYPTYDLSRITNSDWTLVQVDVATPIAAPATCTVTASSSGTATYQYQVTAVDPATGAESIASPTGVLGSAVDIAATAGTITITWSPVSGVNQYNVYKAPVGYDSAAVPAGSLFGFAGSAYGTQFIDSNIVADFTQVPPQHRNPFLPGQIQAASPIAGGSGYTSITFTINTTTGSGAVLQAVIVSGALSAIIIKNPGGGYAPGDTITVNGDGSGATASLTIGPQTGTFPGVVNYFQERRVYGYTLNQPDTYFMSQAGAFTDFDFRIPTISSDAITGNPWSVQVNGIQFFEDMPGGLVTLTGKEAYQLTGTGGSSLNPQPITPSTQQAQPQAFNGSSNKLPPIRIDYEILYTQEKGSIVRDLSYQFYTNIYTGADITLTSSHLFTGHQLVEWAWAEEPFKTVWVVRDDGILLNLCFVKPQEIAGWTRCDTNGLFCSVSSITEFVDNAVYTDAVYFATQRFPAAGPTYMIERLNDRLWNTVEDCWCVDCGLSLAQPEPDATLTASSATGLGAISGFTGLIGGAGYTSGTVGTIVDDNGVGPGTGAVVTLTIVAGVITNVSTTPGADYISPRLDIVDPAGSAGGSGASAIPVLDNSATFTASGSVFALSDVGSVIRMGGGIATVTAYTSAMVVTANITSPIVAVFPDDDGLPVPAKSGAWTMTMPVSQVTGLNHLIGLTVTGLYDGHVLPPVIVPPSGDIDLPAPATSVVVGLGFEVQVQTPYIETPGMTVQGQRKKIGDVTVRIEASRGLLAGSNQQDGSTLSPPQLAPDWNNMSPIDDKAVPPYGSTVVPLYTGDTRLPIIGGWNVHGQVALQQSQPLPMNLLAVIPEVWPGDQPEIQSKPPGGSGGSNAQRR